MKTLLTVSALVTGLALTAGTASATTDDWKEQVFAPSPSAKGWVEQTLAPKGNYKDWASEALAPKGD